MTVSSMDFIEAEYDRRCFLPVVIFYFRSSVARGHYSTTPSGCQKHLALFRIMRQARHALMVLQQSDKVIVMDAHAFSLQERNARETMIFQDRRQAGEKLALRELA